MLSCQHRLEVLPEEELGFAAELRGNDVNRLMGIDGHEAGLGQLLCQAGPYHLHAVQTDNGIYNGAGDILLDQGLCNCLGLTEAALLEGDVNEIVDVAVISGKVSLRHPQGNIALPHRKFGKVQHIFPPVPKGVVPSPRRAKRLFFII